MSIKIVRNAAAILLGLALAPQVNALALDFEGLQDQEAILDFYNGGTGSMGSSGVDYGVSFDANALALIDFDAGGSGNFANEPSADTVAFWLAGSDLLMNVAGGFDTGFSFFYSSSTVATVKVYDGLNGTGNIIGEIDLIAQFDENCAGDPNGTFCNWTAAGVDFAGTALSVSFAGTANQTGYDNITFGSSTPEIVPEPTITALLGIGLVGMTLARRRRRV